MIQSYFKKQEKSQTTLSLYLKLLRKEEEEQKNPKVSRRGKGRNKWNRNKENNDKQWK